MGIGGRAAPIASYNRRPHAAAFSCPVSGRLSEPGVPRSGLERSQRLFDRGRYLRRIRSYVRLETRNHAPIRADEELREIPLNLAARLRIHGLVHQELIERSDVIALPRHLGHLSERHVN